MFAISNNYTTHVGKEKVSEGDWVSGKSVNDEKFRGFVEEVNETNGTIRVKVVACDHIKSIGRTIECFIHSVESLPMDVMNEEGQLYNLIDLALIVNDKTWFLELTSQLKEVQLNLNKIASGQRKSTHRKVKSSRHL